MGSKATELVSLQIVIVAELTKTRNDSDGYARSYIYIHIRAHTQWFENLIAMCDPKPSWEIVKRCCLLDEPI